MCPSPGTFGSIEILFCTSGTLCTPQTGGFERFFLKHCSAKRFSGCISLLIGESPGFAGVTVNVRQFQE